MKGEGRGRAEPVEIGGGTWGRAGGGGWRTRQRHVPPAHPSSHKHIRRITSCMFMLRMNHNGRNPYPRDADSAYTTVNALGVDRGAREPAGTHLPTVPARVSALRRPSQGCITALHGRIHTWRREVLLSWRSRARLREESERPIGPFFGMQWKTRPGQARPGGQQWHADQISGWGAATVGGTIGSGGGDGGAPAAAVASVLLRARGCVCGETAPSAATIARPTHREAGGPPPQAAAARLWGPACGHHRRFGHSETALRLPRHGHRRRTVGLPSRSVVGSVAAMHRQVPPASGEAGELASGREPATRPGRVSGGQPFPIPNARAQCVSFQGTSSVGR